MYELSQRSPGKLCAVSVVDSAYPSSATHIGLSVVIHRLASIGLLSRKTPDPQSRQPSFWEPILPPLLAHLHPPQTSPLAPYPPSYLPSLFLSLPSSIIYSLAGSLIHHLTAKSNYFDGLAPESPDARVKRAAEVLQLVLGPASVESEAFEAVSSKVLTTKSLGNDANVHAVLRMVVTWISFGGDDGESQIPGLILTAFQLSYTSWTRSWLRGPTQSTSNSPYTSLKRVSLTAPPICRPS
jgi:hypothetical protein